LAAIDIAWEAFGKAVIVVVMEMSEEVEFDVMNHAIIKSIHDKSSASNALVIGTFDVFAQL
jgi:hypothetical protein